MKIVLLGDKAFERLTPIIHDHFPDTIITTSEPLDSKLIDTADLFVSYGYRHIIKPEHLNRMKRPPVNLHISLLPWNRGADPNFWSWLDDTPKGVTIHLIDEGVDTGRMIWEGCVQPMAEHSTLKTSYEFMCQQLERGFAQLWPRIRMNEFMTVEQDGIGSVHKKSDLDKYKHLLDVKGWDTPVGEVRSWKLL